LQQAIDLSAELVTGYPNVPEFTAAHARYLDRLGMLTLQAGQPLQAARPHRPAGALQSKRGKVYPDRLAYPPGFGLMERSLGRALGARGEWPEARALLETATTRVEALWQQDRRLEGVRPFLGMAYRELAQALERTGQPQLAAAALRKADTFGKGHGP